ncbi:DUF1080 domain-containing protein [Zunongwangia sp. F260]|uniref:DUF1080 domain-containing protein n=1 Tax=Autumnicola lenta TaxID=3075593 RepID=A0ABU3CJP2_9FLAO|nr:DUF1080 domain-containing protein [Zunongwangia sp. F260]MDT0646516.1 DUF1080 domain-containing protein [Zunongwangia sp. F260]
MKPEKLLIVIIILAVLTSCGNKSKTEKKEVAVKEETKEEQWQTLFNGEDLDDWIVKFHHHEVGDNYANTFQVKDGTVLVDYDEYEEFGERYGHLFYKESFSSFHLKFEYRFTDQWMEDAPDYTYRNSGVMFHSQDPATILKEQDWPISVEYQMLADAGNGDPRPTGNMCSHGTEIYYKNEMYPGHCLNSSSETYKPDEWVQADLIVYRDSLVIHKVNGNTVLEYSKPQIGGEVVGGFDPEIKKDGKPLTQGYIGLQAEGQGVEFKNIKILKLE